MRGWVWVYARYDWFRGLAKLAPRDEVPLRTLYNSSTQQANDCKVGDRVRIQETRPPTTDDHQQPVCSSQRILRLI